MKITRNIPEEALFHRVIRVSSLIGNERLHFLV